MSLNKCLFVKNVKKSLLKSKVSLFKKFPNISFILLKVSTKKSLFDKSVHKNLYLCQLCPQKVLFC